VRNTLVILGLLGAASFVVWNQWDNLFTKAELSSNNEAQQITTESKSSPAIQSAIESNGGTYVEKPVQRNSQPIEAKRTPEPISPSREGEAVKGEASASQALLTIYPSQVNTESETKSQEKSKPKVLFGVPIESWVLSQKDSFAMVPPKQEQGLRVFLGCMEIRKNGLRALGQRDCGELAFKRPSHPDYRLK